MNDSKFDEAVEDFVRAFEEVFHRDWEYTRCMINSGRKGTTFIKPGLKDEIEDWGNRGDLLQKYRTLAGIMKDRTGRPTLDDASKRNASNRLTKGS